MILYIIVPCYNEEEVLPKTKVQIEKKIKSLGKIISNNSKIVFVDDGSTDLTWDIIQKYHKENSLFTGISLSKNSGHQNALLAGLMYAKGKCDIAISMDADLQDDVNAIDEMINKYMEGADIVYGVRSAREKDTFIKRYTAESFYKLMKWLGTESIYNHADYRLMSNRALESLSEFHEVNLYLRGLIPIIGYKTDKVYYERKERVAGKSKYPMKKMLKFAMEGITSFSIKPMHLIVGLGCLMFGLSILILIWSIIGYIYGNTEPGWASLIVSLWGIGGMVLLGIGIVGEYIGKIYLETKARPRYIIESCLEGECSKENILGAENEGGGKTLFLTEKLLQNMENRRD